MVFFKVRKDGGQESKVTGYWLAEIKKLFSVVLLHFADGSRDAYHSHAFNSISWVLKGELNEYPLKVVPYPNPRYFWMPDRPNVYRPSLKPVITPRDMMHKVISKGDTWVLSFRGPWAKYWHEFFINSEGPQFITLTNGRFKIDYKNIEEAING